ncbi:MULTISPECIES: septation regulator SpoVG [Psychrilyobacter]|uniref:Putative septation protein SpoVG n=1 Tax=Psychrilyobacter piezotolerans TaxID=2293438 RepID=A0ABX9KEI5_9FUSO|nr:MULTISPECIES: septation regulator SpoVG [Psychrilyobacter]MCS5420811.1 septation regulator SpoVG [Psychrilyobacter sp. S5]NDI78900.1 septation regulator SpoVG [Psychrilyobacter piezotolerans]RDE59787.1 septation regulator SpoVG [Psychrilyobacter sp. S5]REI40113.1 septation regulator SpoVG [Psychrilyobacter piezotolerans]
MNITDVRLRTVKNENELKLKAYADITLDGSFVIHGLKVIDGQKGMFVAMPSRKMPNGEFKDIAHPITPDLRRILTEIVIKKYNETVEEIQDTEETKTVEDLEKI